MNKTELVQLVEQAYATYNQTLPTAEDRLLTLYSSWHDLLHDLEYDETKKAFLQIAVSAQFMPRPGEIRRATINRRTKMTSFDDPLVAWGKFLTIISNVNSGVGNPVEMSDALRSTVKALGDAAWGMHTNSDREAFCRTYERIVNELDMDRYSVPELDGSK